MRDEQGFTLAEVLVALAVFSIAAIGLIQVAAQGTRTADGLEARFAAKRVAENQLIDTLTNNRPVALGVTEGTEVQMSREFSWTQTVSPSPVARQDLVLVTVMVNDRRTSQELATMSALRARLP